MRFFVLFSTIFLLTSCTQNSYKPVPQKTFQYSYQSPARVLTSPDFSKHLTSSNTGSNIQIKLPNNQLSTAKLGRTYFSASGYECRKYTVQSNFQYSACKIGGRWYENSPIILKN